MTQPTANPSSRVMAKAIFAHSADFYTPFSTVERRHLARLVRQVDRLREFSFFEHPPHRMRGTFQRGVVVDLRADAPSEEAISAVMPIFRELYTSTNPTSAPAILKMLGRHAHERDSAYRDEVISDLRSLRKGIESRRKTDPRGIIFEQTPDGGSITRAPESVIDTWLNGEYFHFDEAKAAEIPEDHPVTEMMKVTLLSALHDFAIIWTHVRNAAFVATREPSLSP